MRKGRAKNSCCHQLCFLAANISANLASDSPTAERPATFQNVLRSFFIFIEQATLVSKFITFLRSPVGGPPLESFSDSGMLPPPLPPLFTETRIAATGRSNESPANLFPKVQRPPDLELTAVVSTVEQNPFSEHFGPGYFLLWLSPSRMEYWGTCSSCKDAFLVQYFDADSMSEEAAKAVRQWSRTFCATAGKDATANGKIGGLPT